VSPRFALLVGAVAALAAAAYGWSQLAPRTHTASDTGLTALEPAVEAR